MVWVDCENSMMVKSLKEEKCVRSVREVRALLIVFRRASDLANWKFWSFPALVIQDWTSRVG